MAGDRRPHASDTIGTNPGIATGRDDALMSTASGAAKAPARAEPRSRLPALDIIIVVAVAGLLIYWFIPAFLYYNKQWGLWLPKQGFFFVRDSYYIHGPLVPIISFLLAWQRRKELAGWLPQAALGGLWLLGLGILMRFFGDRTDMRFVTGFAFVFVLAGLIWFVGGARLIRFLAFPLFFLFFMCPLPSTVYIPLSVPLQVMSTIIAAQMTNLIGIQATRMGAEILTTRGEPVMVGQPCSGFRLMVTLLAAAFIFSYLMEAPLWRKFVLLLMIVPLALVMNSLRVFLLVFINHFWGMQKMHAFHDISGYGIVIVACLVFWWLMRLIGCREYREVE
jgi:exosortase